MQESYILHRNEELWEWLCEERINPYEHTRKMVIEDCLAYKIKDKGYVYYSWIDKSVATMHTALKKHLTVSEWGDVLRIPYYWGVDEMIFRDVTDKALRLLKSVPNVEKRDGYYIFPLPDPRFRLAYMGNK